MGTYSFSDENASYRRSSARTPFLLRADPAAPSLLDLIGPDNDWQSEGACVGADHTLFDPPAEGDRVRGVPEHAVEAARYCQRCPVQARCLASAEERRETGVWAGTWRIGQYSSYRVHPIPLPHSTEVA